MRHIYYNNPETPISNQIKEKEKEVKEVKEENFGFFGGMSKTTKYILIGLVVVVFLLILFLIFRKSSNATVTTTNNIITKRNTSNIPSTEDKLLDIVSNADYNEFIDVNGDNISETGTIDDIIIDGPQTGKPIGNLRYIYF
jgi:hypothetical protein